MSIPKKEYQILAVGLAVGGLAICIAFGGAKLINTPPEHFVDYSKFDAERWKRNANYDRERCVSDLVDRKRLVGLSEQQVIKLLGEPDWKKPGYLGYEIRPETDSFETLYVNLKDGKVSTCELHINP